VTHAPLMTTFMTAELTGKWSPLPLMYVMSWIAWKTAKHVSEKSLYAIATSTPRDGDDGEQVRISKR
jgi:H+/Cl- antiporter ClcA